MSKYTDLVQLGHYQLKFTWLYTGSVTHIHDSGYITDKMIGHSGDWDELVILVVVRYIPLDKVSVCPVSRYNDNSGKTQWHLHVCAVVGLTPM